MKKGKFYVRMTNGFVEVDGYIIECNGVKYGIAHSLNKDNEPMKTWNGTHIDSGLAVAEFRRTRAEVEQFITENAERFVEYFENENVKESVKELYALLNGENGDEKVEEPSRDKSVDEVENPAQERDFGDEVKADIEALDNLGAWERRVARLIELSERYYPTNGGSDEIWEWFIDTYRKDYDMTKDVHINRNGETYIAETLETADEIINIVNTLAECEGTKSEVLGRFIWTSGNTKKYRQVLKKLGFTYMSNKKKWCKSYKGYVRRGRKRYSYAQIQTMYGKTEEEVTA